MDIRVLLLLCCGLLARAAEPVPEGPELLGNPGFEAAGEAGAVAAGWAAFGPSDWGDVAGRAARDAAVARTGGASARLDSVRQRYAVVAPGLPVETTDDLFLTGWLKTALAPGESAYLVASWSGETGWLSLASSRKLTGHRDWTRVALLLPAAKRPAGASRVQISFRVDSPSGQGRAWVDDLSLRACSLPPPPPRLQQEADRQRDLVKSLAATSAGLARRQEALAARLAAIRQLAAGQAYDPAALVQRDRGSHLASGHAEPFEAAWLDEAAQLPARRAACWRLLEELAQAKRALGDEARATLLRAEAAALALRPAARPAAVAGGALPEGATGPPVLSEAVVQAGYRTGPGGAAGVLSVAGAPALAGRLEAELAGLSGRVIWRGGAPLVEGRAAFEGLPVEPWFPDAPRRYQLTLVLVTPDGPADRLTRTVAFRDVRVVESDLSGTLRQAWQLAPTDYTFLINGQAWFPRGTVVNDLSRYPEETATLLEELWLDFQRQYGDSVGMVGGPAAEALAARGQTLLTSLSPDYKAINAFESAEAGLEDYRERADDVAWRLADPAVLGVQVGNEAELSVWGASLPSVYGGDLWHVFSEVITSLREAAVPAAPVSYVRAGHYGAVLPAPGEDYSGVNQYTGRYWGTRRTIAADLANLSLAAWYDDAPFGITEWNGPKYSWATRGLSGVDEEGAASYLFDYWRELQRATGSVLSTEFVLNWVVTPVEDLTSVPLAEGLARRAGWTWNLQQGTPWYPRVWPDLLTDTPGRRAMRGFDSPVYDLAEAPGDLTILAGPAHRAAAQRLQEALGRLGRTATVAEPTDGALAGNVLLLGGLGDAQPAAIRRLEGLGVLGRTDADFPAAGGYTIQRRLNPDAPDRMIVAVTAADAAGWDQAIARLLAAADSLEEAYRRRASQRRVLALVPDSGQAVADFERYVVELPARGYFLARDDVRRSITAAELDEAAGLDLGFVIVAADQPLAPAVRRKLLELADGGVAVVWSAATLAADPAVARDLGLALGPKHRLDGPVPVAEFARQPLAVPDMGSVDLGRLARFGGFNPDQGLGARALWAAEVTGASWTAAATAEGQPVVVRRGHHWVFGVDLAAAVRVHNSATQRGVNHTIYDRDTANGLERIFRVVTNAGLAARAERPASTPRLRAVIAAPAQMAEGGPLTVEVQVRDQAGQPADATVRLGLADAGRSNYAAPPRQFSPAERVATGRYRWTATPEQIAAVGPLLVSSYRGLQRLGVFAAVDQPGAVGDWLATTVRVGEATDEGARLAALVERVRAGQVEIPFHVETKDTFIELDAALLLPTTLRPGEPVPLTLTILRVESDEGNDWLDEVEMVLTPERGDAVVLPVVPGKLFASARAAEVKKRPDDSIVVTSSRPATVPLVWERPAAGRWTVSLRYRYTDEYRGAASDRVPRDDPFAGLVLEIGSELGAAGRD